MPSKNKAKASSAYTKINQVKLIRAGEEYFSVLVKLICDAKDSIHIQAYIFDDDKTGTLVANALKEAAARHINVHVMADGYASQRMSKTFITEMRVAGVHFRFFEPFFGSRYFYFGRRMHHKVAVFDMLYGLVGGINIADRYNDMPEKPAWLDFAMYVEGQIAKELCILCWKTWYGFSRSMPVTPCEQKQIVFNLPPENLSDVRMRRNDWVRRKNEISSTYVEMFLSAEKEVTILCSYFLPGKVIRKQMAKAVRRGVTVRVIAAGHSDVILAKNAERWLYDWLLRNGIELYEYQKTILHGKLAVCDDQWLTIGSYNINNISTYASIELNLDVRNKDFAIHVRQVMEEIIQKDCIPITAEHQTKTNNLIKQFIRWLSYQFIRIVFYLFTFYFKHLN
jgi:cardiolipin synthase A/B